MGDNLGGVEVRNWQKRDDFWSKGFHVEKLGEDMKGYDKDVSL